MKEDLNIGVFKSCQWCGIAYHFNKAQICLLRMDENAGKDLIYLELSEVQPGKKRSKHRNESAFQEICSILRLH